MGGETVLDRPRESASEIVPPEKLMQRLLEFEPVPALGWRGSDRELILAGDEKTVIPLRSERLGNHCQ